MDKNRELPLSAERNHEMDEVLPGAKAPRKMGNRTKTAIGIAAGLFALGAGLNYTIDKRNELPTIVIPVSPEPNPNARSFFIAAGNGIQDGKAVGYAMSNLPQTNQSQTKNAAIPNFSRSAVSDDHVYTLAEKEKLIRENQSSLALLREGFHYGYGNKTSRSARDLFPEYAKFRELARLLVLEAQVKRGHADYAGAVGSELDALEIGVMVPRNGVLIAGLVGIACEAIGRRKIWDDYSHLDAAQAESALRRLTAIEAKRFAYADTIEEEKRFGQAEFLAECRSADGVPANEAAEMDETDGRQESAMQKWGWKMRVRLIGSRTIFENYTGYMDQFIQDQRQPYGLHLPPPPVPNDPVNSILLPVFNEGRIKFVQSETENHLLAVTLALHAYHESHGAYPDSLTAVAANVPANLLSDPFAAQENLRYRKDGAEYVLYSVGPDGRDDGGKPVYDKNKPMSSDGSERARYFVEQNSAGDVVAGVNE